MFPNAPVSDHSSAVPVRNGWLSMDEQLQAHVLASSAARRALVDCFSQTGLTSAV